LKVQVTEMRLLARRPVRRPPVFCLLFTCFTPLIILFRKKYHPAYRPRPGLVGR